MEMVNNESSVPGVRREEARGRQDIKDVQGSETSMHGTITVHVSYIHSNSKNMRQPRAHCTVNSGRR